MTPNCCSFALLLNSHSVWILEEEDGRATYISFPTSSTLCFMSSTRTYLADVFTVNITCKMSQLINSFDSTRATSREEKNLQSFQEQPCEKWVESSYDVEGPHYYTIFAMHIMPPERWRTSRLYFLRRLLVTAHARKVSAVSTNK